MAKTVFDIVTEKVTELLDKGTIPWRKPWTGKDNIVKPVNVTGREYNGINYFLLSCLGYETPVFLTFKQIQDRGGKIKDGEEKKHFPVFFWAFNKYNKDAKGNATEERTVPICRYYLVWNIEQTTCELPAKLKDQTVERVQNFGTIEAAETIVANYENGPTIKVKDGSNRACYCPTTDIVSVPHKDQFTSLEEYYSTLFHELSHSTGHGSRLNRKEVVSPTFFGSHDYSVEELVAEMGAAFLCNHAGIHNTLDNSAAYINGWLSKLKSDPKMLMTAAGRAQKAFERIVGKKATDVAE